MTDKKIPGVGKYRPDIKGTRDAMNSREMRSHINYATHKAKLFAESISPVGDERNGHYVDRFEVRVKTHGGPRRDRAEGTLTNTSDYATAVEAQHRVLRRTLDEVSDR